MKDILKLAAILVIGILAYNYFWGTEEEKASANKIFQEVKEVGIAVKDLLKEEKDKFDSGKYDDALDKIGDIFKNLKKKANDNGEDISDKLDELENKRLKLEKRLADYNDASELKQQGFMPKGGDVGLKEDTIKKEMERLMQETNQLLEEAELQY